MFYIASEDNDADSPSQHTSDLDYSLSESSWKLVESSFVPHSFALMAIPPNVKRNRDGHNVRFFSPFPCEGSSGVNFYSQSILPDENYYVFPSFILIGHLITFLNNNKMRLTLVAPDVLPRKYWWPILQSICTDCILLGRKNDEDVIIFPPNSTKGWHSRRLPWNLYAFRILLYLSFRLPYKSQELYRNQRQHVVLVGTLTTLILSSARSVVPRRFL